ncbi:MAG: hypothetical protein Q9184_001590 [Pyrenodesmia sp. 2 TL-2023]
MSLLLPPNSIIIHQQSTASSINNHFQTKSSIPISNPSKTSIFPTQPKPTKMQFKNIVAFVSLAVMASALPAENIVARTNSGQCSSTQTLSCCNSITDTTVGVEILPIGQGCTALLPGQQCAQNSKTACCSSGSQTGVVNVGPVCPQVL